MTVARIRGAIAAAWAAGALAAPSLAAQDDAAGAVDSRTPIVVASKPFAESYLLAEAFAQLLEASGYAVDRRPGLGMTELALGALIRGDIDVYPEYTGTGLAAVLGESAAGGSAAVFRRVSEEFEARWGVRWLPPLGFENTYAIAMRRDVADSLDVRTLSGLAAVAQDLAGGFSPDFIGRADGLDGLAAAYGIRFRESRSLLQAVKYQALAEDAVDVIDAYSTDGAISRYDLALLADDRNFFPPYDAAPLVSRKLYADRPGAVLVLTRLAGRIDEEAVQRANERIEVDAAPIPVAARELLADVGMIDAPGDEARSPSASRRTRSTVAALPGYMWTNRADLGRQFGRHLLLVLASLGAAILVALPAGVVLERRRSLAEGTIRLSGLLQTIPGIALLAFMIPLFGIGVAPAVVALFLYSLLPILRNTYTGIIEAAPDAVAAGRALGMTEVQLLGRVRLPLAAPVIMAGVRTAAVINVGTATLAAFIGAGGLGDPIVAGLTLSDPVMILSGAVPSAVLALFVDWGLARAEVAVAPKGVAEGRR
ncbi:MAG: ABC transporter permease subunit [Gemmatimonadetes bacterium]|nr:ABC transporter permease subunit [Gemmatimonadota bacterium]